MTAEYYAMSEVARILDGHGSLLLHCSRLITRLLLTLPELLRSARGRVILRLVIIIWLLVGILRCLMFLRCRCVLIFSRNFSRRENSLLLALFFLIGPRFFWCRFHSLLRLSGQINVEHYVQHACACYFIDGCHSCCFLMLCCFLFILIGIVISLSNLFAS